jgi:hypothetical protein
MSIKGFFKTMGEEKWIKRHHEIKKNIRVAFMKNLEILKIAGSRAELLDLDF